MTTNSTPARSSDQCLGALLRINRVDQGLTLEDAAAQCRRFSASRLGGWECATRPLPVDMLHALARTYGVDMGLLLQEAERASGASAKPWPL